MRHNAKEKEMTSSIDYQTVLIRLGAGTSSTPGWGFPEGGAPAGAELGAPAPANSNCPRTPSPAGSNPIPLR